jgi:hypothetical protein
MRLARAGQAVHWRRSGAGFYPRYPRYPHAHYAWTDSLFMTAFRGGRDDLPATGESLPSHSLSQSQAGRLRAAGQVEAKGRAADEAAARRKLRACPLADAKAAGFVKRPSGYQAAFGHAGDPGRPDTGSSDPGPARRKAGLRSLRRHRRGKRFGADLSGRTGLRPGSCETGGPRTSVHGRQAEPRLRPRHPAINGTKASAAGPRWGEEGREFQTAERRTARASALVGEPAGKPAPALAGKGPRRKRRREPPVYGAATRNRPARDASPPRLGSGKGTVGAGGDAGPHYCLGRADGSGAVGWSVPGRSSRTRPVSWQRP